MTIARILTPEADARRAAARAAHRRRQAARGIPPREVLTDEERRRRDRERSRRYKAEHPDRVDTWRPPRERQTEAVRRWRAANPEKAAASYAQSNQVRRARQAGVVRERVYRSVVWTRDEGWCYLCGYAVDPADWHLDHVIPLAEQGPHTYANVAVTHPTCNMSKGARGWTP